MGFFQTLGNIAFGPGKVVGEAIFGKKGENDLPMEAANAPLDTRIRDIQEKSAQNAQTFQDALPARSHATKELAESIARRQADEGVKGVRRSANQRGLLYSGLREADEAGIRADAARGVNEQVARANAQDQQTSFDLSNQAIMQKALLEQLVQNQQSRRDSLDQAQSEGQGGLPLMPLNKLSNW